MGGEHTRRTPGPWRVAATDDSLVLADKRLKIASTYEVDGDAWGAANARLIAASPTMLEAITAHLAARDALADAPLTSLSADDPRFAEVARTLDGLRAAAAAATGGRDDLG